MKTSPPELSPRSGDSRAARAILTYVADPADLLLGGLLQAADPCEIMAAIQSGSAPDAMSRQLNPGQQARIGPRLAQWRVRLAAIPAGTLLGSLEARSVHLLCPGDPGWPSQLDDLGLARPYALWVRGTMNLRDLCGQSVAVVGSRAATAYGTHMCADITAGLSASGWVIVSGGAHGIDVTAHRAALACGGRTVAVLACGPDLAYPRAHAGLFDDIAAHGVVVSEYPPGTPPARHRFLARDRLIAALAGGTLVVEAAQSSGTLVTALRATELARPVMALPGPVTSATSAGCHLLIRAGEAVLVTVPPRRPLACFPGRLWKMADSQAERRLSWKRWFPAISRLSSARSTVLTDTGEAFSRLRICRTEVHTCMVGLVPLRDAQGFTAEFQAGASVWALNGESP